MPKAVTWALIGQGFSSATNFSLTLLAARTLGPSGLGAVAVGFSAYLVALGFQRSLLVDPLIAVSAALPERARVDATRAAITTMIAMACVASLLLLAGAVTVPGYVGKGLLLFVPWVGLALAHDFSKSILFRDERGSGAALSDLIRFLAIVPAAALVWSTASDWAVVACWGVATGLGSAFALSRVWLRPESRAAAIRWWRSEAWPFGRWLGLEGVTYTLGTYASTFVLAALLTAGSIGGLQAVQSVFVPLSLLIPVMTLAGLPAVARRLAVSPPTGMRLALLLGLTGTVLTALYVGAMTIGGSDLLTLLFSTSFEQFSSLILPISVGALISAMAIGFHILLKAQRRGRSILVGGAGGSLTSLIAAVTLAAAYGVEGAAWGLTAGSAVSTVLFTAFALGIGRSSAANRSADDRVRVATTDDTGQPVR